MAVRILRRTAQMLVVVLGAATLTFFVLRLAAGDPARLVNPPGTPEDIVTQVRQRLGTDKPLLVQYKDYLVNLVQGDLGVSFHGEQPVRDAVLSAVPNTLALAAVTIVIASIVGLGLGILAALYANRFGDRVILVYVALAQSTPNFWLAVVLVLVFSIQLQWLPAIDLTGPESFVLPVTTLVVMLTPVLIRTVRQSFLETLGEDHVRAARARGLPERRVLLVHGLKVTALPLVTLIGLQAGFVLAGAYVVEFIFNWPGIGKLTLDAINSRDFPMIQGGVLTAAVGFVLVNF
ncbi:MAG TPA: ABC transporter permease, partial [Gaiellaceae bacterium]|nr:ABC transporter permease [Gaiellaceae bacterium]